MMKSKPLQIIVFFLTSILPTGSCVIAETMVSIDLNTKYQEIDNIGASGAWTATGIGKYWSVSGKSEAAKLLFSQELDANGNPEGIGLSAWRFNIGGGSTLPGHELLGSDGEWGHNNWRSADCFKSSESASFDPDAQTGGVWFLKQAQEHGVEDLIGFVNSPPVWLTRNGRAHHSRSADNHQKIEYASNLPDDKHDEFAKYLVEVIQYLQVNEGVELDYISPINEPTWDWVDKSEQDEKDEGIYYEKNQEGCPYNNQQVRSVIEHLYDALNEAGLGHVHIDGPDAVEYTSVVDKSFVENSGLWEGQFNYNQGMNKNGLGVYKEYLKLFLEDPVFAEKTHHTVSMHGYWSDYDEWRLKEGRELVLANKNHYNPEAKIWMSEVCGLGKGPLRSWNNSRHTGSDMTAALHWSRTMHFDFTRLNASAWHWWTAISNVNFDDGLLFTSTDFTRADTSDETLIQTKQLWALGNFSRFIRPGYRRVELANADDVCGLMGSAYVSPEEDKLVVVLVNQGCSSEAIQLEGLEQRSSEFRIYLTDYQHNLEHVGVSGDTYTVPAKSVVTLQCGLNKTVTNPN